MKGSPPYTDQELFVRIAEGDTAAYREVFHAYNEKLLPFITAVVKSAVEAREIMQEVLLKLWVNRDKLTTIDNPCGWLHTVASNAAYDHLRKIASYELMLSRSQSVQSNADEEFWKDINALQIRTIIHEAMLKLPPRRRQIFRMNKIEGFSRKEIANQLGISENSVRNQLLDAVSFVRDYLKKTSIILLPLLSFL